MVKPRRRFTPYMALTLLTAALWFGTRLVSKAPSRKEAPSRIGASMAAKGFVKKELLKQPESLGKATISPITQADQSPENEALWTVTGSGWTGIKDHKSYVKVIGKQN